MCYKLLIQKGSYGSNPNRTHTGQSSKDEEKSAVTSFSKLNTTFLLWMKLKNSWKSLAVLKCLLEKYPLKVEDGQRVWRHQDQEDEQQWAGEHKPKPTYIKKKYRFSTEKNIDGFQKKDFQLNDKASPTVPTVHATAKNRSLTPL